MILALIALLDATLATTPFPVVSPVGAPAAISLQSQADLQSNSVSVGGVGALEGGNGQSGRLSVSLDGGRGDAGGSNTVSSETSAPSWIGGRLDLKSNVSLGDLGSLTLNASQLMHQDVVSESRFSLGESLKEETSAGGVLKLPPAGPLSNQLGAETNIEFDGSWTGGDSKVLTATNVERTRVYYSGVLTASARMMLTTSASLVTQTVNGDLDGSRDQTRSTFFSPLVAVIWTPWRSGKWSLSAERHVDPLSTSDYVAALYNRAQEGRFDLAVTPSNDLRYIAEMEQQLPGGISASLRLRQISDGIEVERLMLSPEIETPNSVRLDAAQEARFSVKTPVPLNALPGAVLEATADWNHSVVVDPLTAERRGLSGEQPLQLKLGLVQSLPASPFSWGVHSAAGGRRTYFGDGSSLSVDAPPSWDAFLQYQPGPVLMRLQISGVAGQATTLSGGRIQVFDQQPYGAFAGLQSDAPQVSFLIKSAL